MGAPSIFIGSSTEQLATARALKEALANDAHVVVWDEADFGLGHSVFAGLLKAADEFDFAVFVFNTDDLALIRRSTVATIRDNVLFEFGLFVGRLGRERAFWVSSKGTAPTHLPTDLAGIIHLSFDTPTESTRASLVIALEGISERLRRAIDRVGLRTDRTLQTITSPRILCVASTQYSEPKFDSDIRRIQGYFPPGSVESAHGVGADRLLDYLTESRHYDIVHFAMYVDANTGDLLIPEPDEPSRNSRIPIAGVENMVSMAQPKLVVIVTCDSVALAVRIGKLTNTVAGHRPIGVDVALEWSAVFYKLLARGVAFSEAFTRAQAIADPGLLSILKQDFRIELNPAD